MSVTLKCLWRHRYLRQVEQIDSESTRMKVDPTSLTRRKVSGATRLSGVA
jgi:hypothetical protein